MQRVFGVLAVFGGWLCILLSAIFGLIATQFLGLNHVEGELPPSGIYGVPAIVVLWIAIGTALLTSVPAAAAMFAADSSRRLYVAAAVMGAAGVALLPDDLGRAYAAALIPGAALLAAGGWFIHGAGAIGAGADAPAETGIGVTEPVTEPATGPATDPVAQAAAPGRRSARRSAKAPAKSRATTDAECPWCSAPIATGAERCPSCGAALTSAAELAAVAIPGVTAVAPELREYEAKVSRQKKRPGLLSMVLGESDDRLAAIPGGPLDPVVLRPPSAEVRAEMERLDREIASGSIADGAPTEPPPSPEI
jgi:hypothetical protein